MKRILLLTSLFAGLVFSACQSNSLLDKQSNDTDLLTSDSEWEFTKDLTLTNGNNTAYLRICSNYEDSLNNYLEGIDISLIIRTYENMEENKQLEEIFSPYENQIVDGLDKNNLSFQEPSVIIQHLGCNLEPNVYSHSIRFAPKLLKAFNPIPIEAHETPVENRFIGIVAEADGGVNLYVKTMFKTSWYSSWTQFAIGTTLTRPGYIYKYADFVPYKLRMQLYRDTEDRVYPTYDFFDVVNDFQRTGTNCLIGSYDGATCYVGTPPSGTTAFISSGNKFYYTPVNGNQCPLAGSSYDGANCFVANVPEYAVASVWNNKWYVLSYVTSDLFGKVE